MANIVTAIDPNPSIFPFTTLPESLTDRSVLPRAEVVFQDLAAVITSAGVGDTQALVFRCACPENFAYAMVEAHFNISGPAGEADNWDNVMRGTFGGSEFTATFEMSSNGVYHNIGGGGGPDGRIWSLTAPVLGLAKPKPAAANTMSVKVGNSSTGGAEMLLAGYVRFMMYDISQIHHASVNTPQLIR